MAFAENTAAWHYQWISRADAADGEETLFRQEYRIDGAPETAFVSIADAGRHTLYVNGYVVSPYVLEPGNGDGGDTLYVRTYEVGRYMHGGTNVVAIWHAPSPSLTEASRKVGAIVYGRDYYGKRFAYAADSTWLCRAAGARLTADGGEEIDGAHYDGEWKTAGDCLVAWQGATSADMEAELPVREMPLYAAEGLSVAHSINPVIIYENEGEVTYQFDRRFDGWVRLTLRGMEPGAVITAGSLRYVCSGTTDEQCCRRFTSATQSEVTVKLPPGATQENITQVEGLVIGRGHIPN